MSILTKDAILAAKDYKMEKVSCPEWGGDVYVRSLSGEEKTAFQNSLFEEGEDGTPVRKEGYMKALATGMLVRSICDKDGNRLFEDQDVDALFKKSAKVLDRIQTVCDDLNGVGQKAVEKAVKK